MYKERPSRFPGGVLWERTEPRTAPTARPDPPGAGRSAAGTPAVTQARPAARVLPDGCMDLIWVGGRLLVAGPDTEAHLVPARHGESYVGLRFAPGTAPALLGVPACELRDRRAPLADLWPAARVRRLTERIAAAPDAGAALEEAAARWLARRATGAGPCVPDPAVAEIVARARAGEPVSQTAAALGLSDRQLRRRSLAAFGYPPKTLARILRLHRALDLVRTGLPYAVVAADAGYADQAHLAREVKALTGVPLGTLIPHR